MNDKSRASMIFFIKIHTSNISCYKDMSAVYHNLNIAPNVPMLIDPLLAKTMKKWTVQTKNIYINQHFITILLKINENMVKNLLKPTLEKEEKELGLDKVESHKWTWSCMPQPYQLMMTQYHPTEFYSQYLSKRIQIKAKKWYPIKISFIQHLNDNLSLKW